MLFLGVETLRDYMVSSVRDDFPTPTQPQHDRVPVLGRSFSRLLLGISHARPTHTCEAGTWEHFRVPHGHLNFSSYTYHCVHINIIETNFNVRSSYLYVMKNIKFKDHTTINLRKVERKTCQWQRHYNRVVCKNELMWSTPNTKNFE